MTENPAPDTTPDGRGQDREGKDQAGQGAPQQPGHQSQPTAPLPAHWPGKGGNAPDSAQDTPASGQGHPTERQGPAPWPNSPAPGHPGQPAQGQPEPGRPGQPAPGQPVPGQPAQSQQANQPTLQNHGGQEHQGFGQAGSYNGAQSGHGGQAPSYPRHQPFYGAQSQPPHAPYSGSHAAPAGVHALGPRQGLDTTPRRKPAFGVGTLVASILAAGLVGGGVVAGSNALFGPDTPAAVSSTQPGTVIVNNKDDVNVITAAAAKASPSVVTIKASSGNSGGTGSGIILDGEGHILTNTHVVTLDGTTASPSLEVRTSDGRVLKATVVGTDPLSDLAVIKLENAGSLVPATLGDSSKINVGDTAVAIGSPLGLTGTVTDGIVSTLNRTITVASSAAPKNGADNPQGDDRGFQFAPPDGSQGQRNANEGSISLNVIQTDAAINPGNSGGALVNSKGEVIGVNVAIASAGSGTSDSSSGNIGVGFSVPINHAKRVAQEIIQNGKASHGQFGVTVRAKSASGSSSGFSVGAQVASVAQGSAAAKAGIQVGDVITKFGDLGISDPNQLTAAVREQPAGATVKVTLQRNGQQQEIDVTLDAAQQ